MTYQVLARKWRPQIFADVVGQQHVLTTLANGLSLGRLHHAYLFSGTRGVGKTTIARLLAKGLNCKQGITATPCGQCESCLEIEQGRFVDLIEIDAASRTKVEDTRDLLDNVQYAPAKGRFKVYLIDEVHMLSRHSFNALLKTLEEPPGHVKFLLATTDPQKLPVTILSRCLQFHLKALDAEQIITQLGDILQREQIDAEPAALPLLARAAQGSLRDALSLLDQAIALGNGQVSRSAVAEMLGSLDNDQPLALVSALIAGDGQQVINLIQQVATHGVEWEALLIEMLRLLHSVAMLQLSPAGLNEIYHQHHDKLTELARKLPAEDLQLYYQILLVGRKELPFAPEPRMGVEMTLLRALAFHPLNLIDSPDVSPQPMAGRSNTDRIATTAPVADSPIRDQAGPVLPDTPESVVGQSSQSATNQLLQARAQLLRVGAQQLKKSEPVALDAQPVSDAGSKVSAMAKRVGKPVVNKAPEPVNQADSYRWRSAIKNEKPIQTVTTPQLLRDALEHEKTPELSLYLNEQAQLRDSWSAQIAQLALPRLVQQLALNCWKTQQGNRVFLHCRSAQKHLHTRTSEKALAGALSHLIGETVELIIESDDNLDRMTPLEWRQAIYEEKLAQARQSITTDPHINRLITMFDARLDDESIRPL